MCGIAGFSGKFNQDLLPAMSQLLAHRGPDGHGEFRAPEFGIGLAHRRLAVIEPTPKGSQPMALPDESLIVTYNGEIFNYRELAAELAGKGHQLQGRSDTEVLLHLYRRYGLDMFSRMNGMYAFALWDTVQRSLLLARDGIGVKPLYYCEMSAGVLFASEIKALLACGEVPRDLDHEALDEHLTFLWTAAPRTILRAVRKLPPGSAMLVREGRVTRRWQHYDIPYDGTRHKATTIGLASDLRSRVQQAVERQMVSDVPLGAFLSGGLDSSSVVAMMRQVQPNRRPICYTIGFRGARDLDGSPADLPYARQVARHLDVDLREIVVDPTIIGHLEQVLYHLDEPQADPAPINALLVAQQARADGIPVLLSGAGGDDMFSGYRRHLAVRLRWLAPPLLGQMWAGLPGWAHSTTIGGPTLRRIRYMLARANLRGDTWLASLLAWSLARQRRPLFSAALRHRLGDRDEFESLGRSLANIPHERDPLNRLLYLDGKHFLADHNLNYTDKMGMAAGVEVRVPLLDTDLVEFAASIPPKLKQHGLQGKYIFRRAMEPLLPRNVVYRPKTGFGVPLRRWVRRELCTMIDDVLSEDAIRRRGLFDPVAVRALIQHDRSGKVDGAYLIFSVLCVELWCRLFLDRRMLA